MPEFNCGARDRFALWADFLNKNKLSHVAEIGVYRGAFATRLLADCPGIERYTMLDPWRNLSDWNKPANTDSDTFEEYYKESLASTEFAADRRRVLRGKTTEMAGEIEDESLDFVYIDGDHTLRGITIDLISLWPKVKQGGWLAGDDFCESIWQHPANFEPTLIFPFAVHFAEAQRCKIYALPFNQYAIHKSAPPAEFGFIDLTGTYGDVTIGRQLKAGGVAKWAE
jgi:hypothetical protein